MYHDRPLAFIAPTARREAMWTSNPAKLAPKPNQYMVLHPSALLPFAFFLLSSFDLLIASRDLRRLFASRLRHFATIANILRYLQFTFSS
jgi:hypothetical protein